MPIWGNVRFGLSRWWERYTPITRSTITLSTTANTICTISHANEGGQKMPEYALGTIVKLSANFKSAGVDVDPGTVQLIVKSPLGVTTTFLYGTDAELVKDSIGDYSLLYTPTSEGRYSYRFLATGSYAGANESFFDIRESVFN